MTIIVSLLTLLHTHKILNLSHENLQKPLIHQLPSATFLQVTLKARPNIRMDILLTSYGSDTSVLMIVSSILMSFVFNPAVVIKKKLDADNYVGLKD